MIKTKYDDDPEYVAWLNTLSGNDVDEILYDFFCCLDEQENEIFAFDIPLIDIQKRISIKFHQDSVLFDPDKDVATLSYQILKDYYPDSITKEIIKTARMRKISV